jgi:hypothetical protein
VHSLEQRIGREHRDVTVHGHVGDAEVVHLVGDAHAPGQADLLEDALVALGGEHGPSAAEPLNDC